jgi:hypothetical protein
VFPHVWSDGAVSIEATSLQRDYDEALGRLNKELQEREVALGALHEEAMKAKEEEVQALAGEKAQLQALVDDSAAAHKAHAELKELRIKYKYGSIASVVAEIVVTGGFYALIACVHGHVRCWQSSPRPEVV